MSEMMNEHETHEKGPTRTCVGCGRRDGADALVRLVLDPTGTSSANVAVDAAGGAFGRGAHVHAAADCITKAARGGLSRAFKRKVEVDRQALADQIAGALERRMTGLLVAARRTKALAIGADAACEALDDGAPLVVVACDAGTIAEANAIRKAVGEGRAMAWKDKAALGALLGRDEVAVLALKSGPIADEMKRARAMVASASGSSEWSREVR